MTNNTPTTQAEQWSGTRRRLLNYLAVGTALTLGGTTSATAHAARDRTSVTTVQDQGTEPSVSDLVFFSVGDIDCTIVNDGYFVYPNPAATMFTSAPQDELVDVLSEQGLDVETWASYFSPYPSLLIEADDQLVLVDTGGGNLAPTTGRLQANLHTVGVAPRDIDVVFLTHAHSDHIFGNVTETGDPAFPNATYIISRTEWEFWLNDPDLSPLSVGEDFKALLRAGPQAMLPPIETQMELIDGETQLAPGVTAVPARGHTPGHFAVEVASNGEQFFHLGDVALHPLHVPYPEWLAAVDYDAEGTIATRKNVYAQVATNNIEVLGYHFPSPGLGHVREAADGWQWDPVKSG